MLTWFLYSRVWINVTIVWLETIINRLSLLDTILSVWERIIYLAPCLFFLIGRYVMWKTIYWEKKKQREGEKTKCIRRRRKSYWMALISSGLIGNKKGFRKKRLELGSNFFFWNSTRSEGEAERARQKWKSGRH